MQLKLNRIEMLRKNAKEEMMKQILAVKKFSIGDISTKIESLNLPSEKRKPKPVKISPRPVPNNFHYPVMQYIADKKHMMDPILHV